MQRAGRGGGVLVCSLFRFVKTGPHVAQTGLKLGIARGSIELGISFVF